VPLAAGLRDRDRRLHLIDKRLKYDVAIVVKLAGLMRRLGTQVAHGYLFDAEIATRLAARLAGVPVVIGSERNTDYVLKRVQLAAYRATRRACDLVIANSRAGAAFNRRLLGHDAERYRVVHNGVDTKRFRPRDAAEARRKLGIGADEGVIGMFASFKAQKNHPLLFAASRQVLQRCPRTRFVFVGEQLHGGLHGSSEYRRRMDGLIEEAGIRGQCLFHRELGIF
jgi:glycosyltransferase involved in cell wall biosynthesis